MGIILATALGFFTLLIVAGAIFSVWVFTESLIYQVLLRPALERDLGFLEGTAYLRGQGPHGYIAAVCLSRVDPDGPLGKAGCCAGDALPDESHTSLFKKLHRHRGKTLELAVVDGGEGPPFSARPRRVIRLVVPQVARERDAGK